MPRFGDDHLLWLLESHFAEIEDSGGYGDRPKKKIAGLIEESKRNFIEQVGYFVLFYFLSRSLPKIFRICTSSNLRTSTL